MDRSLARFLQEKPAVAPGERCEMCTAALAAEHSHVVDMHDRRLLCACRPCYLLFTYQGAAQGRMKAVPDRVVHLHDLRIDDAQWNALAIPINLAFFFTNSQANALAAFYPGPAGAAESELPLEVAKSILQTHPLLATMEPDVEALLIERSLEGPQRAFLVPIDACYELVGVIRTHWKGFDGGDEARATIDAFFARLLERSGTMTGARS
ncbi:MAG: DUF5947 family protein [Candidatus Eremiobacteraeota bacterium]|nr:DUF5947 family protein [Candidatus Eremiobacteraeota bacterium]